MHQTTKTTMTYALRLPPHLDASAHRHADYLGLSFNGFVCVAVEAYLRANPVLPEPIGLPDPPVNPEAPLPSMGGKSEVKEKKGKKETFKDRQRARDTAFK